MVSTRSSLIGCIKISHLLLFCHKISSNHFSKAISQPSSHNSSSLLSFLKAWKMSTSWLPLYTHTAAATARQYPTQTKLGSYNSSTSRKPYGNTLSCRAASSITDFDLYDLLGIDSSSDSSRIKAAYRALQKQCHPDIAGPAGHDMSIILNEAYSLLSDPSSRLAYDKVRTQIH